MPQGYETYLQQALSKYRNPDSTKRDVLTAIQHYRGLFPKMDTFVFNDGLSKELLNLDGTIPVPYKGNTYNIPVCVWLLDTHPTHPPICYVKPTADMQIKVSRHVDQSGKVYLPYLHEWKQNSSDLCGLIQVMIVVFGEQPPVYSRRRQHGEDAPQQPALPPPPLSTNPHLNQPMPMYPAAGSPYGMPMPMPKPGSTQPIPPPQQPSSMSSYPPPYPATTYAPASSSGYGYQAPGYAGYPPATNAPTYPSYPTPGGPYATPTTYPPYSSQPPPIPPPPLSNAHQNSTTNTITEEHIKASLLSAVEEKLRRRLREVYAQAQTEMEVLKRTQDDLNRGKAKLENMINKLEQEQGELDNNVKVLNDKNKTLDELLAKMETQEQIDVDEAVVTVAPLYKQLLNAFAEENAIEDAIYYLGEALRRQVIDLDVFLKHVREMSRKQFMLRALMLKCREKANLPT